MNQERLDQAFNLADGGRIEEALEIIRLEEESWDDAEEKGAAILVQVSLLLSVGRTREAGDCLRRADRVLPPDSDARMGIDYAQAEIDFREGRTKAALACFERIERCYSRLREVPGFEDLWKSVDIRWGIVLANLTRYKEACELLERALGYEWKEKDATFYETLADCYYQMGQFERAEEQYQHALSLGMDQFREARARHSLGYIYFKQRRYELAKVEYERCLALNAHSDIPRKTLLRSLAATCRELHAPKEAENYDRMSKS